MASNKMTESNSENSATCIVTTDWAATITPDEFVVFPAASTAILR
jgi:hypothetical protein